MRNEETVLELAQEIKGVDVGGAWKRAEGKAVDVVAREEYEDGEERERGVWEKGKHGVDHEEEWEREIEVWGNYGLRGMMKECMEVWEGADEEEEEEHQNEVEEVSFLKVSNARIGVDLNAMGPVSVVDVLEKRYMGGLGRWVSWMNEVDEEEEEEEIQRVCEDEAEGGETVG